MKRIFVLVISLLLVGCSAQTTSDANSESLKAQIEELQKENKELKEQLSALSSDDTVKKPEAKKETKKSGKFDERDVLSKLEVKEYSYVNSINSYQLFLVITNNSDNDISIKSDLTTKDSDGNLIGAKSADSRAFEQGSTICLSYYLDEEPSSYEYEFTVEKEDNYKSILSNLSYETSIAKDKVVLSVTNNGDIPAEFVEYTCLFFNGDVLVGADSGYTTDDDFELKPEKTINKEARSWEDFDSVQIYLTGRG